MAIDVSVEIEIDRPRSEVAAVMFDPTQDARWTQAVVEARPLQDGPLRAGAEVERVSKFLGRRLEYRIEVTDAQPDRYVEMHATEPFEMRVRYELDDRGEDKSVARIRTRGGGTGFFRLAAPLLSGQVRRAIAADLAQLKICVEGD